jgi:hypothetical protein
MVRELALRDAHLKDAKALVGAKGPPGANNGDLGTSRPRWILYHGTSSARLKHILEEDCLSTLGQLGRPPSAATWFDLADAASAPAASELASGMRARFTKYRTNETGGMFTPGEQVYIHAVQEQKDDDSLIQDQKIKVYICTKASDAEAAKADPNLEVVQAEELADGQLRLETDPEPRIPKVALTTERSVAEYWACLAAADDQHNHPDAESRGVVLVLNGERLLELDLDLIHEEDSWQNAIGCWDEIFPLADVLIGVKEVTPQRHDEIEAEGLGAVLPASPLAGIELTAMSDTIMALVEGFITPAGADAVVSALAALRLAMEINVHGAELPAALSYET